jgi:hypothetical protein
VKKKSQQILKWHLSELPRSIEELLGSDVSSENSRKLVFNFYTRSQEKADLLRQSLSRLGYSARSKKGWIRFLITGLTPEMQTDLNCMKLWMEQMCRLGFEHDAIFDGWNVQSQNNK